MMRFIECRGDGARKFRNWRLEGNTQRCDLEKREVREEWISQSFWGLLFLGRDSAVYEVPIREASFYDASPDWSVFGVLWGLGRCCLGRRRNCRLGDATNDDCSVLKHSFNEWSFGCGLVT